MLPHYSDFAFLLLIWLFVACVLLVFCWKRRQFTVGVTVTFLIILTVTHAIQAIVYTLPWYSPEDDPAVVLSGFSYATLALVCFVVGNLFVYTFVRSYRKRKGFILEKKTPPKTQDRTKQELAPYIYIATGLVSYFVLIPLFQNAPTLTAFFTGLKDLLPIGIILAMWSNLKREKVNWLMMGILFALALVWPLVTVTLDGFLGFGLLPTVVIVVFLLFQFKRARLLILMLPIALYIGISLFSAYYLNRNNIRDAVWGGTSLQNRTDVVFSSIFGQFAFFDLTNQQQLRAIDDRMGQNNLVGLGVQHIDNQVVEPAYGQTYADGFLMLIPRAIWTDKTLSIGGQALVNQYTGLYLYGSTSVSLGPVLELYVNFGIFGVIVGFILFGILIRSIDEKIGHALQQRRFMTAALWFAPTLALLLTEDNFITIISAAVSAFLTLCIYNFVVNVLLSAGLRKLPKDNLVFRNLPIASSEHE